MFPDVETTGRGEGVPRSAEPSGGLLETDSDDSDDESFKVQHALPGCAQNTPHVGDVWIAVSDSPGPRLVCEELRLPGSRRRRWLIVRS